MHAIPIPKPATANGTSPQLGGYFFLKRQDHRISVIGGLILVILTLAAGISVFVVMQRQAESLLSKSLEVSLQSNVRLFESRIDQALANTHTATVRPFAIKNLQLLASNQTMPQQRSNYSGSPNHFCRPISQACLITMFVVMK